MKKELQEIWPIGKQNIISEGISGSAEPLIFEAGLIFVLSKCLS
jgi:hypothetical protein